jgi:hypothetical protein
VISVAATAKKKEEQKLQVTFCTERPSNVDET